MGAVPSSKDVLGRITLGMWLCGLIIGRMYVQLPGLLTATLLPRRIVARGSFKRSFWIASALSYYVYVSPPLLLYLLSRGDMLVPIVRCFLINFTYLLAISFAHSPLELSWYLFRRRPITLRATMALECARRLSTNFARSLVYFWRT